MEGKPIVICTYRDRFTHMQCLILYMRRFYPELQLAIIEQDDILPWNKGLLYNAGYKELAKDYDYLILHDIDFIPVLGKVDYKYCTIPTMIAGEASQFNYKPPYKDFFGGVVVLSKEHYEAVNGFPNSLKGYGADDDIFQRSFVMKNIPTATKNGRFECFAHPRPKNQEDYEHNCRLLAQGRDFKDGLSSAQYTVVSKIETNYIHLKINTCQ